MNEFTPKIYGVKRINNFFAVEATSPFGDMTKYDFVLKDCLSGSQNGNDGYRVDVMTEVCGDVYLNGWKLEYLGFPGNWYGQWSYYNIIDKFGCAYRNKESATKQMWYNRQPEVMIRETLLELLRFTEQNHSTKYRNIIEGFYVPTYEVTIEKFIELSDTISQYIKDYQDVVELLNEENASSEMFEHLKEGFDNQIKKCFPFKIKIEEKK